MVENESINTLLVKEKYEEVVALFLAMPKNNKIPRTYIVCSKAFFALNMNIDAINTVENGVLHYPKSVNLRIRHAECSMLAKEWEVAISRWVHIIDKFQNFPGIVYWRLVRAYINKNDFFNARKIVDVIRSLEGESQKLIDLIAVIDSKEAKKYNFYFKKLPSKVNYRIASIKDKEAIGKLSLFSNYRLRGWVERPKGYSCKLIVKSSEKVIEYEMNSIRKDVVAHFSSKLEVDENCGFDYNIDISKGAKIGFLINNKEYFVLSISFKIILDVLKGRDGWLFLANDANGSVDQYTGKKLITESVKNDWIKFAEKLLSYQLSYNLKYFIANSKEKVVSDKYPFPMGKKTVTDEVKDIFDDLNVHYIYPLDKMISVDGAYYKTDTHWSDYGAYLGFLECISQSGYNDKIEGISFEESDVVGDLGAKLVPPIKSKKKIHVYPNNTVRRTFFNNLSGTGAVMVLENSTALYDKCAVLFGGSSLRSGSFYKYFSYLFNRVVVVNLPGSIVSELIEFEQPDVVVVQTNERYLIKPGVIYDGYSQSPLFKKVASLTLEEKTALKRDLEKYDSESFYVNKTISALSFES